MAEVVEDEDELGGTFVLPTGVSTAVVVVLYVTPDCWVVLTTSAVDGNLCIDEDPVILLEPDRINDSTEFGEELVACKSLDGEVTEKDISIVFEIDTAGFVFPDDDVRDAWLGGTGLATFDEPAAIELETMLRGGVVGSDFEHEELGAVAAEFVATDKPGVVVRLTPPLSCIRAVGHDEGDDVMRSVDKALKTPDDADKLLAALLELPDMVDKLLAMLLELLAVVDKLLAALLEFFAVIDKLFAVLLELFAVVDKLFAALLELPAVAKIDEAVEHCGFEELANGRTSVPFTVNDTSAQSLMLRLFVA